MRVPSVLSRATPRHVLVAGVVLVVALGLTLVVVSLRDDDGGQVDLSTEGTSTTTESSTTTTSTTTTSTTTTTTTTTTTAPPTTPPPPPPTTTTPPPPTAGSLDIAAVRDFAKANRDPAAEAPYTYTGANVCPETPELPSDSGDDARGDIGSSYLVRYCDGVYRAVFSMNDAVPIDYFFLAADTGAGGCGGMDHVVIGWRVPSGQSISQRGAVVATPTCDSSTWRWVDAAGTPMWAEAWLQLDFRGTALGDPTSFRWMGGVRADGDSAAEIDLVPNAGTLTFAR